MKAKFSKKQNGFVVSDAILAILVLIMFTGIITSLIYNVILTSKRIKISSQEIAYITDVFNHVDLMNYDEVTAQNLISYVNQKSDSRNSLSAGYNTYGLWTPYRMSINVETYKPTDETIEQKDLIKIINIKVECTLGKKTYSTEMNTMRKIKDIELGVVDFNT